MTVTVKMAAVIQKLTDNQKEFTADGNDIYNLILKYIIRIFSVNV